MYVLKEETKKKLKLYKLCVISKEIGINYSKLSAMIKKNEPCIRITAYAITKFLNGNEEINKYFIKK